MRVLLLEDDPSRSRRHTDTGIIQRGRKSPAELIQARFEVYSVHRAPRLEYTAVAELRVRMPPLIAKRPRGSASPFSGIWSGL
jgi:hypothetical protein